MEKEIILNISKEFEKSSFELSCKISEIIEENVKKISEKYEVEPKKIILQIKNNHGNLTEYGIALIVHEFTIENKFTYGEEGDIKCQN